MAPRTPSVKINVQGARGESQADILRRTGQYGVKPTDTDEEVMDKLASAGVSEVLPNFADTLLKPYVDDAEEASDIAKAWASSPNAPDPSDPSSKSAKTLAEEVSGEVEFVKTALGGTDTAANVTPVDGNTTASSNNSIIYSTPMESNGSIEKLYIYANASGTVNIVSYRSTGGEPIETGVAVTRIINSPITVVSGANEIDLSSTNNLDFNSGDIIGLNGNGVMKMTSGSSAGGPRYYVMTGATATVGNLTPDNRWEFGFGIRYAYNHDTSLAVEVDKINASTTISIEEIINSASDTRDNLQSQIDKLNGINGLRDFVSLMPNALVGFAAPSNFLSLTTWKSVATREGNQIVSKSYGKRRFTEPSALGVYDFSYVNSELDWCNANNMGYHYHVLSWYDGNPAWFQALLDSSDSLDFVTYMTKYFEDIVGTMSGKVDSYDCANECFNPASSGPITRTCPEYNRWGYDYMEQPFYVAQSIDPNALRILNQNFVYGDRSTDEALRQYIGDYMEDAIGRGVPIQAIGIQSHIQPGVIDVDTAGLANFIQRMNGLGVKTVLSEVTFQTPVDSGTNDERDRRSRVQLNALLETYMSNIDLGSQNPMIRFWGLHAGSSDYPGQRAEIFDSAYNKIRPYYAVSDALRRFK